MLWQFGTYCNVFFFKFTDPGEYPEEIYPLNVIDKDDTKGSCSAFDTRKPLLSIKESEFDDTIVFVASQVEREKVVMGSNYDPILAKKLIPIQWVILERIGRSRFHGVTTTGQESLQNFAKINAKDLFYHRKVMLRHGLVTKQNIGNYDLK